MSTITISNYATTADGDYALFCVVDANGDEMWYEDVDLHGLAERLFGGVGALVQGEAIDPADCPDCKVHA